MKVFGNVLEMIGRTPMLELRQHDTGPCRLFLKLELRSGRLDPKDRIGLTMIEKPSANDLANGTIIEATAGNRLGLALEAAQKGYRVVLVLPDKMSQEKIFNLRAMGAEVVLTRSDVEKGHPEYYQDVGARLARENGWYHINQFANPDNPKAHATTTGPEIVEQMGGKVDAVVVGVGSSGTIAGLTQCFRERAPSVEIILADPEGSVLADQVNQGRYGMRALAGRGHRRGLHPVICDFSMCRRATASDGESLRTARNPAQEGLLVGSSTVPSSRRRCATAAAEAAEAGRDLRLRHRQQVPVEAVQ
jgi:cystathionine beta-synthase